MRCDGSRSSRPSRGCSPLPAEPGARYFVAAWPDADLRRHLVELQSAEGWRGKAVPPERLHLTLAFIGAVPADRLAALSDAVSCDGWPSDALLLDRVGWFPRARVGWLGSRQRPTEAWSTAVSALHASIRAAGFHVDRRPWVPHVTLYRHLRKPPPKMSVEPWSWRPQGAQLVASIDGPGGVRYQPVGATGR